MGLPSLAPAMYGQLSSHVLTASPSAGCDSDLSVTPPTWPSAKTVYSTCTVPVMPSWMACSGASGLLGWQAACGVLNEVMTIAGACITLSLFGSACVAPATAQ